MRGTTMGRQQWKRKRKHGGSGKEPREGVVRKIETKEKTKKKKELRNESGMKGRKRGEAKETLEKKERNMIGDLK